jgi:hypothetical protein
MLKFPEEKKKGRLTLHFRCWYYGVLFRRSCNLSIPYKDTNPVTHPDPPVSPLDFGPSLFPAPPLHTSIREVIQIMYSAPIFSGAPINKRTPPLSHYEPPLSSPYFFRAPAAPVDSEEKINHGFDNPAQPDSYKGFIRSTE